MPSEEMKQLDLTKPQDCREFLRSIKVDCRPVTEFTLSSGKKIAVDEMDDEQAVHYANELYFDLFNGEDDGGHVNTSISTGAN